MRTRDLSQRRWARPRSRWWAMVLLAVVMWTFHLTQASAGTTVVPPPRMVISEVFVDPLLVADRVGEFVEVVNLSKRPVRISHLELLTRAGRRIRPLSAADRSLPPAGVLVLHAYRSGPGVIKAAGLRLPNRAGRLELYWRGKLIDVAHWVDRWPWPKPRPGCSLERVSPTSDGRLGRSWRRSTVPLRGVERASPGRVRWRRARRARRRPVAVARRRLQVQRMGSSRSSARNATR